MFGKLHIKILDAMKTKYCQERLIRTVSLCMNEKLIRRDSLLDANNNPKMS